MRVLIVKSTSASAPLAEIRTDGRVLDFIVDNTDGALPEATQGSYERLISMVRRSSHMVIEEPQTPVAHLLRYVMNNGDVVEITTDGKTCLLNGKLLGVEQKNALFAAISRGEISVAHKADITKPVPVMPIGDTRPKDKPKRNFSLRENLEKALVKRLKIKSEKDASSNADYDHRIEDMNLAGIEDAESIKAFAYHLKYGKKAGRR